MVAAVRYAADAGLTVGVQATGHGVGVPADGVLVSTRRMRTVQVDPTTRTVRVAAGARGRDLTTALVPHGLAPLGGSSPDVGVVGYHLGGGLPLLGRTFGYAADRVRALDVVTADGTPRTVTPDTEPDLFWALLGCRGSFGVVTALVTEALPLTSVVGGGLWFTGDAIAPAVHRWVEWTAGLPETMNSSVLIMRLPDLPAIPEAVRGRRIAHVRVAARRPARRGRGAARPAAGRRAGPATPSPNCRSARWAASTTSRPARSCSSPATPCSARSTAAGAAALLEHADSDAFLVEVRHLGGALARADGRAVVGRRDGEFVLYTGSALATPVDREPAAAAQARLHEALAPWGIGAVTPAFLAGPHVTRRPALGLQRRATGPGCAMSSGDGTRPTCSGWRRSAQLPSSTTSEPRRADDRPAAAHRTRHAGGPAPRKGPGRRDVP